MPAPARRTLLGAGAALLGLVLAGCGQHTVSVSATQGVDRAALDASVEAALATLYRTQPGARRLGDRAKAVLVFPRIVQAGLGVGGFYGDGAMREGGRTTGYYNIAGGTFGFQVGAQTLAQAYFFNTDEALGTFRETKGFVVGAGVTVTAADFGVSGEVSSATLQKPLVVVTWGQSGLMAGAMLEGAKITRIEP